MFIKYLEKKFDNFQICCFTFSLQWRLTLSKKADNSVKYFAEGNIVVHRAACFSERLAPRGLSRSNKTSREMDGRFPKRKKKFKKHSIWSTEHLTKKSAAGFRVSKKNKKTPNVRLDWPAKYFISFSKRFSSCVRYAMQTVDFVIIIGVSASTWKEKIADKRKINIQRNSRLEDSVEFILTK